MNYSYTINLTNQDTTPSYVVSGYPANKMPHLNAGDTLTFNFQLDSDVTLANCQLFVRAIVAGESNSPFIEQGQSDQIYNISPNSQLTVGANNGLWTFSILGFIKVPNLSASGGTIAIPFFIDPDMDVGNGSPP
jgi:hypothetical protein